MKQFTSHINFSLTKKRIKMMSVSKSIWRALPIMLVVVSTTSMIALISCQETKFETVAYTAKDLHGMMPKTSRVDVELTTEGNTGLFHPLDKRTGIYLGPDGKPYTGEQNTYNIESGLHTSKCIFVNGKNIRREYYEYDKNGKYRGEDFIEFSIDENGSTVSKFFSNAHSDSVVLWFERIDDGKLLKTYHPNGQLQRTESYLTDYSIPELLKHGLISEYDEDGNLTLQERYERGELIEKIK